jgi:hypothetical protein
MLLDRATVCAKRMASLFEILTPCAAICSRTMPVKVCPERTEVLHAATLPSGANAPEGLALASARVKAGAVRAYAN